MGDSSLQMLRPKLRRPAASNEESSLGAAQVFYGPLRKPGLRPGYSLRSKPRDVSVGGAALAKKNYQPTLIQFLILLLLICLLCNCSTPGTYMGPSDMTKPVQAEGGFATPEFIPIAPGVFAQNAFHEYRVGPQDILTIIVWNHPELTIPSMQTTSDSVNIYNHLNESTNNPTGILIDERGEIFFPLAGKLKVTNLTVDEIRSRITKRLIRYIRNPQVSVRVSAFRNKPIYIIGEVSRPGILTITDMPMSIMDALNQVGGIDRETSDPSYIYVIRGSFRKPKVFWLNATTPGAILMAETFQLQSRDVLYVSTAGVVRWSRTVNRILPTIQTFMNPPINMKTDRN